MISIQEWKRRLNGYVEQRANEKLVMEFSDPFCEKATQMGYDPEIIDEVLTEQLSKIIE